MASVGQEAITLIQMLELSSIAAGRNKLICSDAGWRASFRIYLRRLREMPSFSMRDASVVRFIPSFEAAP